MNGRQRGGDVGGHDVVRSAVDNAAGDDAIVEHNVLTDD